MVTKLLICFLPLSVLFQTQWSCTHAFVATQQRIVKPTKDVRHHELRMSNQFDVTKPVFDLFSLRSIRGDALTKYNSLNQSEPLRINLSLLFAFTFLAAPYLSQELNDVALSAPQVGLSVVGSVFCGGAFVRECSRRSKQLTRMEKELNALELQVRLPANRFADSQYLNAQPLKNLMNKSSQTVRILAVSGTAAELKQTLLPLRVLGRRLVQASAYVVAVPTDNSKAKDWGVDERSPWMAEPNQLKQWQNYFEDLSDDENAATSPSKFRWFGLSAIGRSFGSGKGVYPEWLQVLGQHLRPTEILDETDRSEDDVEGVLAQQSRFYQALTNGDLDDMKAMWSTQSVSNVEDVVNQGGRLDEWKVCLEDGARPAGMKVAGSDVLVVSETLAYSTVIEFPVTEGLETAMLLAVQTWERSGPEDDWKLQLHQTIPWTPDMPAFGTLLCDCRGCVSLTRGPERRTFGGIIG